MAWTKTSSRHISKWHQISDDPTVFFRSILVFLRDGLLIGIISGMFIANTIGLPTDEFREQREQDARHREAVEESARAKVDWCGKHPEMPMCKEDNGERHRSDFDRMK